MMIRVDEVILGARQTASALTVFRGVLEDEIGRAFVALLDAISSEEEDARLVASAYGRLFALLAEEQELSSGDVVGDAWQSHLVDRIIADENALSRKAELVGWENIGPSTIEAARFDLGALYHLYHLDADLISEAVQRAVAETGIDRPINWPKWEAIKGLAGSNSASDALNDLKRRFAGCDDWGSLVEDLVDYWRVAGVGLFGTYRAFRWIRRDGQGLLEGIAYPDPIRLVELIGYAPERELLIRNTEHFVAGFPANNVLLYGDRGTGKSSTVKALLNEYGQRGLRLIEVSKQHLDDFPQVLAMIRHRPERFILFVDDLSFEDNESHYKELKAVLEGNLEARPENVILYATSNRRHLIRETFSDRQVDLQIEIDPGDTYEEKLSLSDRFGITLTFQSPNQDRYLAIVSGLAESRGLAISPEDLRFRALQWAIRHNGRSGRTARQFVDFLTGELGVKST